MKRYNLATESVVNMAKLKGKAAYLPMPSGGVRHYQDCSEDELIAAGYLAFAEDSVPQHYQGGVPVDIKDATSVHRTYPAPVLDAAPWRAQLLAATQTKKIQKRDGGFSINGTLFDSDAGANVAYLNFYTRIAVDPEYTTPWKASGNTWVNMDAVLFAKVSAGFQANMEAAFGWQAQMDAALATALDTYAALKAIEDAINEA